MPAPHNIALLAFDDCLLIDVAGPASVFGVANTMAGRKAYELKFVSPYGGAGSHLLRHDYADSRAGGGVAAQRRHFTGGGWLDRGDAQVH